MFTLFLFHYYFMKLEYLIKFFNELVQKNNSEKIKEKIHFFYEMVYILNKFSKDWFYSYNYIFLFMENFIMYRKSYLDKYVFQVDNFVRILPRKEFFEILSIFAKRNRELLKI